MSSPIAIDLGTLGDGILLALLEDDASKRREAAVAWKDSVLSAVQEALPEALSTYIQDVLGRWSKINDSYRREVLTNDLARQQNYSLLLRLTTTSRGPRQQETPEPVMRPPQSVVGGSGGSQAAQAGSPNDDRSDSMNPNNESYRAAANNHANQLNPNNPAYHSSRGLGRR